MKPAFETRKRRPHCMSGRPRLQETRWMAIIGLELSMLAPQALVTVY
jgi:hypothetical protein